MLHLETGVTILLKKRQDKNGADAVTQAILVGNAPIHVHAHNLTDIERVVDIFETHEISYILVHATQFEWSSELLTSLSYSINQFGYCKGVICGPLLNGVTKEEPQHKNIAKIAEIIMETSIPVSITTDYPVTQPIAGPLSVELLIREGVPVLTAIDTITTNPAKLLGLNDYYKFDKGGQFNYNLYPQNPFVFANVSFRPINDR